MYFNVYVLGKKCLTITQVPHLWLKCQRLLKLLYVGCWPRLLLAGGTDPDACSPPHPRTTSGTGEKRRGIGVRKFMGQNQDKENTHWLLKKVLIWGHRCKMLSPPLLPTPSQLQTAPYEQSNAFPFLSMLHCE